MIRVILVDDHLIFREGTRVLLARDSDIEVVGACGSSEEALALVKEVHPDVVLLDVRLQGGSGIEVARRVHQQHTGTKILILSTFAYETYVRSLFAIGVHGYLLKGTTGNSLSDAVRAIHRGELVIDPDIPKKLTVSGPRSGLAFSSGLTIRELDVLRLVRDGINNKEIADELILSVRTIEFYMSHIMAKLGARSRTEAVNLALQAKIIGNE